MSVGAYDHYPSTDGKILDSSVRVGNSGEGKKRNYAENKII